MQFWHEQDIHSCSSSYQNRIRQRFMSLGLKEQSNASA